MPVSVTGKDASARVMTSGTRRRAQQQILNIERTFSPEHGQVLRSDRRFIVLVAGRRWGKTTLALWMLLLHAVGAPVGTGVGTL